MALIPSLLTDRFNVFFDPQSDDFNGFPSASQQAANLWADALNAYASQVIPVSTTSEPARLAMLTSLSDININQQNGRIVLPQAFAAYATQLATGMTTFTGVPPLISINFDPVYALGLLGGSSSEVLSLLVNIIDTWFRTGTAIPPVGAAVFWS